MQLTDDIFTFSGDLYIAVKTRKNKCDGCDFSGNSRGEIVGCWKSPPCSCEERADGFEIIWKKERNEMLEEQIKRIADSLETIANAIGGLEFEAAAEPKKAAKTAKKAEKPTKKAEKPAEEPKKTAEAVKTEVEEPKKAEADVPTLDDVVKALQAHMKEQGRDSAVELLGKYDAKRASDIPEDKRADFITDATSANDLAS